MPTDAIIKVTNTTAAHGYVEIVQSGYKVSTEEKKNYLITIAWSFSNC